MVHQTNSKAETGFDQSTLISTTNFFNLYISLIDPYFPLLLSLTLCLQLVVVNNSNETLKNRIILVFLDKLLLRITQTLRNITVGV